MNFGRIIEKFWDPRYIRRRKRVARQVLHGSGIEIGALYKPLPVAAGVKVAYVDRMSVQQLRLQYPELASENLVPVDVVDDGERLETFADNSQDFVIANHFLEHTQDPIGTLKAHLRIVKPGGVLYLAVPNRDATFDKDRPLTKWDHLKRDHLEGPAGSYKGHLREYACLVEHLNGQALEDRIEELAETQYSIHFHVWNEIEFRAFLDCARSEFNIAYEVEYFDHLHFEILAVLRKK